MERLADDDILLADEHTVMYPYDIANTVDSPTHYMLFSGLELGNYLSIEATDVIEKMLDKSEEWLTLNQGRHYSNVLKYVLRAPDKNRLEDLKKARKYLGWMIDSLEEE